MYHTIAIRANYWVVREKRLALDGLGSTMAVLESFNSLSHALFFLFAVLSVSHVIFLMFICSIWNTFHLFCIYLCVASEGLITKRSPIISWRTLQSPQSKIIYNCCTSIKHLGRPATPVANNGATTGHDASFKRPIIYYQIQLDSQY